ncbi:MAG: aspartate/glutamate racemase family protein [Brachymonas sp.]
MKVKSCKKQAVQALLDQGAGAVVLACTEIPLSLDAVQSKLRPRCIDSTSSLARACVAWWRNDAGFAHNR